MFSGNWSASTEKIIYHYIVANLEEKLEPINLYRERSGLLLDSVGVSSSVGISFWVAHGAFGYFFSMANLKLLKKVHLLPKLSLATRLKEYYDWEEHM